MLAWLCLPVDLQVKDPEKYYFKPKELLTTICSIYLHLARSDTKGVFTAAIAADARSYRQDMFAEAALVLRQFGLLPEQEVSRKSEVTSAGCKGG